MNPTAKMEGVSMRPYAILLAWIFVLGSTSACFGAEPKEPAVLQHSTSVISIAFTPDGKTLVSSGGKVIKLWDIPSGKERTALPNGHAKAIAVSSDGKWLATGNWDETVRL